MMVLDETGNVVTRINMDDWGNLNKFRVGSKTEINYTGKKMDVATGLYYFNQRYYDAEIGRFIQEDLAKEYLNPYVYVGNNAANLIDPDGLLTFAQLNGCNTCESSKLEPRGVEFEPSYGGDSMSSLPSGDIGGFSPVSFGSSPIVISRGRALPNVVQGPMSGGEKQSGLEMLAKLWTHFQTGRGAEYHIDASTLDFSGTSQRQLKLTWLKPGESKGVNLFDAGINSKSLAFGKVKMINKGNNQFAIEPDFFDFNIEWENGMTWRNAGTVLGKAINHTVMSRYFGGPYDIVFDGTATIPK